MFECVYEHGGDTVHAHVCVSGVCLHVCVTWKVRVRDSDPVLVFWWARWVTAAVAEEAEVDEGEEQEDEEGKDSCLGKGENDKEEEKGCREEMED